MGFSPRVSWPCLTASASPPAPSLLQWTLHLCVSVCVCVCERESTCLCLLLEEDELLHYSFIPFLSNSPVFCFISLSSGSTFPNLPSIPPLHCCYASWRMPFVAWSGFSGFSVTTALVCLVINCVSLYLPLVALGLVELGVGWVPASPNWFFNSNLHFIAPSFQCGFSPESICIFTVSFTAYRKDTLTPPHTLNLFFGIEVTTAWMLRNIKVPFPPTHMHQCIFTPYAFLFLFPAI